MTVREWIRNKEIHGDTSFSVDAIIKDFSDTSEQIVRNDLYRLNTQGVITSIYNGFYVIVPVQYAAKGIIPPLYYIDQLMAFIGKAYYVSLLNAAELLGVAHQRPQRFYVTTTFPKATVSNSKNATLNWTFRTEIPKKFLLTINSETGIIRYSNAELTAVDLVQYSQHIGGLSRAATLLSELMELTDFSDKIVELLEFSTLATLQRLGYILESVLEEEEQAEVIYKQLTATNRRLNYIPLNSQIKEKGDENNNKWKININTDIEVDEV